MNRIFHIIIILIAISNSTNAQNLIDCWHVNAVDKVSETKGGFGGNLDLGSRFGCSIEVIGDYDGDGINELGVGNFYNDDGGVKRGAFWVLFMNSNNTVKSEVRISSTTGGLGAVLNNDDNFGYRVAALGDMDGDGVPDLAVSRHLADNVGVDDGTIFVLYMNANGSVKSKVEIGEGLGGLNVGLVSNDKFGFGVGSIGDLNGDGVNDIAVGAIGDTDGGANSGAVYILFMNANGTVASNQKISATSGGLTGLPAGTLFGTSIDGIGDLNGDGTLDIVVGAGRDNDGGTNRGAIWVLFMNSNGTVSSSQKISDTQGNFGYGLSNNYSFGWTVAGEIDIDGDGINDITTGSYGGNDGGPERGESYILFMNTNGTVREYLTISQLQGNFNTVLDDNDRYGKSTAILGDVNGDGYIEIAYGADQDDNGGTDQGAFYIVHLDTTPPVLVTTSDTTICQATPVQLFVAGAQTYLWNNANLLDDSSSATPILTTSSSVIMKVEGTDAFGCIGREQVLVNYNLGGNIFPIDTSFCNGEYLVATQPGALAYLWSTGDTTESIRVQTTGTYKVTVTLPAGCIANGNTDVTFSNPVVDMGDDTLICIGDAAHLVAWPHDSISILWNTGDTGRVLTTSDTGLYSVIVGDSGCQGFDEVRVDKFPALFLEWDSVLAKCLDKSLILEGEIPLASYIWNANQDARLYQINDTGTITLEVTNLCESIYDTIRIIDGNCECEVYMPNSFTPDGNDVNDIYKPKINCFYDYYVFRIFDRWGVMVFETFDQTQGWDGYVDGKLMHQGVYTWRIEKSFSNESGVESVMGKVNLIRR